MAQKPGSDLSGKQNSPKKGVLVEENRFSIIGAHEADDPEEGVTGAPVDADKGLNKGGR